MIPPEFEPRLRQLVDCFLEENAKINLSAYRTPETCWDGNVRDSLAVLDVAERIGLIDGASVLDVGTGGGFPLLPVAVCRPGARFAGLDSTRKKIEAVRRIVETVGIWNVEKLIDERTEVVGHSRHEREQYDVVLARAIGSLPVLLEYCSPFAKVGGRLVIWKSLHIAEELTACRRAEDTLQCEREEAFVYDLGEELGERQLLIYRKIGPTPREYPRGVGMAKKSPL